MATSAQSTILVVGATGYLGTEICRQLTASGENVRGLVRTTSDAGKVQALQQMGVETVTGDLKDERSLRQAMQGVTAVISTASSTLSRQEGDSIESVDNLGQRGAIEAARAAGVQQFTFVSFCPIPGNFPLQAAKRAVEWHLMQSGMAYTILQPTIFMEVWLSPAIGFDYPQAKATIYGSGRNRISWIAIPDVAAFAVEALRNPALRNKTIPLGGPEALSPLEVVRIFEEAGGRQFEVQQVPEEALKAQMASAQDALSASFAALMLGYAAGSEINMEEPLKAFPRRLRPVKEYARQCYQAEPA